MLLPIWYQKILTCFSYLLNIFGLVLPCTQLRYTSDESYTGFKKCYALFLSCGLLSGYVYVQWLSAQIKNKTTRTSNVILLCCVETLITIICVVTVLSNAFWKRASWSQLMKLQKIVRKKMNIESFTRNRFYFVSEIILGHFCFIFLATSDQYGNFFGDGRLVDQLKYIAATFINDFMCYYIFLNTIIIYNSALMLKNNYQSLNTFLLNSMGVDSSVFNFCSAKLGPTITVIEDNTFGKLLEASKILNILFECGEIFNNIFGFVTFLMNISTVLIILVSLNTVLIYGDVNQLTFEVTMNCVCRFLMFMTWNSFIISSCGLLKREALLLIRLCCKLQHSLPYSSKERQELLNLARQINRKPTVVSAGGFYNVDFGLIFSTFSIVGTYIVALIQFSHIDF